VLLAEATGQKTTSNPHLYHVPCLYPFDDYAHIHTFSTSALAEIYAHLNLFDSVTAVLVIW
jgi:hypothetical protein